MDNKKKPSNKKESSNKKRLKVSINKVKYFITSAKISLILAIVFVCILITQRESNYFPTLLSSNTALLAIFIKIEWDEHKKRNKNKYNNQRLILAYYNELKNMQLVFKQNKYRKREIDADIDIIEKKMQEAEYNEQPVDVYYNKAIKKEIDRGLYNLQRLEVRLSNHERLEKSIKNMLLETNLTISESLFEELWGVQKQYHKLYIKPLDYDKLREKISGTMLEKDPKLFFIEYERWKEIYKSLNAIEINVMVDEYMECKINNMINELESDK